MVLPFGRRRYFQLFFSGTFAPFRLAFESPMAIACFLLLTFLPLPLRSVPFFRLCIVFLTDFCAPLPYLAIVASLVDSREPIQSPCKREAKAFTSFARS